MSHVRGREKIPYATREDALAAAQRRWEEAKVRLVPYRCTYRRRGSVHPLLRAEEHWHLKTYVRKGPSGELRRWHEDMNTELGARAVGCLLVENARGRDRKLISIKQRGQAALERRTKEAA